jgi:hypothetical protein
MPNIFVKTVFHHARIAASLLIIALAACGCERHSATVAPPPAATAPVHVPAVAARYAELVRDAEAYNADNPEMSKWLMNGEHCFVAGAVDPDLQDRVIAFVRDPEGLDLIFDRLLDSHPGDLEVLIDAQFLIYAGGYRKTPDEIIEGGKRAQELLTAAENGRFRDAERRYPTAPIRQRIENAARRVLAGGKI